jgi:hypothetical protein
MGNRFGCGVLRLAAVVSLLLTASGCFWHERRRDRDVYVVEPRRAEHEERREERHERHEERREERR